MDDDELIASVYRKIEREKALINAATNMRQSTDNPLVQQRVDANIRDGRKNIAYLEEKMRELQFRRLGDGGQSPQTSPQAGSPTEQRRSGPPLGYFAERGDYGDPGPGGYGHGGTGSMSARGPYADPRPFAPVPKARPNYSKLGM
jgi:classical protein kinase C alpha type